MKQMFEGPLMKRVAEMKPEEFRTPPKNEEGTYEKLGTLSHFEQGCYTIAAELREKISAMKKEADSDETTNGQSKKLLAEASRLNRQQDSLMEIMWFNVMERLDLWEKNLTLNGNSILDKGEESSRRMPGISILEVGVASC